MNSTEENTMLNLGLKLGENLKKFRLQRELTQEQLADVLCVSAQAVSRWENGTTYPDITLLPTIASYFEITLDELMGMENWRSEEQLKKLLGQLEENGSKGLIYENILLLRDAVKTYPTNYELQFRLVNQLAFCEYKDGRGLSEEEKISFNREAAEIGNRILSHCTDGAIINQTTQQLCYIYSSLGEKEKAIEYAKKLPNIGCTDTVVLGDLYEGEQLLSATQNAKSGKPRDKPKLSGINQHKADCYAVCCVSQVVHPARCSKVSCQKNRCVFASIFLYLLKRRSVLNNRFKLF